MGNKGRACGAYAGPAVGRGVTLATQTDVAIADNFRLTRPLLSACEYDGRGYRTAKTSNVAPGGQSGWWHRTDYYYNDHWQVLEERTIANAPSPLMGEGWGEGDMTPHVQYIWDIRYIDSPVCRLRDANGGSSGDGVLEETLYYTTDANFNVTALVTTAGAVVERYVYDPYGKIMFLDANWQPTEVEGHDDGTASAYSNEVLYCGYRHDPETGSYHVRARQYHPTLSVWLQRDPAGYADGASLHAYCRDNPITGLDPSGARILLLTNPDPDYPSDMEYKMLRQLLESRGVTGYQVHVSERGFLFTGPLPGWPAAVPGEHIQGMNLAAMISAESTFEFTSLDELLRIYGARYPAPLAPVQRRLSRALSPEVQAQIAGLQSRRSWLNILIADLNHFAQNDQRGLTARIRIVLEALRLSAKRPDLECLIPQHVGTDIQFHGCSKAEDHTRRFMGFPALVTWVERHIAPARDTYGQGWLWVDSGGKPQHPNALLDAASRLCPPLDALRSDWTYSQQYREAAGRPSYPAPPQPAGVYGQAPSLYPIALALMHETIHVYLTERLIGVGGHTRTALTALTHADTGTFRDAWRALEGRVWRDWVDCRTLYTELTKTPAQLRQQWSAEIGQLDATLQALRGPSGP